MGANPALKAARRSNLTLLLASIAVLLAVGAIAAFTTVPYWVATLTGPHELTAEELLNLDTDSLPKYAVKIKGDEMFDTGYYWETKMWGIIPTETKNYGALLIGDKFILIETTGTIDDTITEYVGIIETNDSDTREVVDKVISDVPELRGSILTYRLSTIVLYWYIGTGIVVVAILGAIYGLFNALSRYTNPSRHPIMKRIANYGDPSDIVDTVQKDFVMGENKVGKLRFGKNWLEYNVAGDYSVAKYADVMWAYKNIVTGRYNSKTYSVMVYDRYGNLIQVTDKESNVDSMLREIATRAPWAVLGHSAEAKKVWDKSKQEFAAAVDGKRKSMEQS